MKFKVLLTLSVLFLFSCEEMPKTVEDESNVVVTIDKEEGETIIKKITTKQEIEELSELELQMEDNGSMMDVSFGDLNIEVLVKEGVMYISSNCEFVDDFSRDISGNLKSFIVTDVNGDGFNEFYCVTNRGDIVAYSSYNNKSFGEIYVKEKPNVFYKDFNDVEFWEVKNKKLLITFSNGYENKLNMVRYSLNKGESGYQLVAN